MKKKNQRYQRLFCAICGQKEDLRQLYPQRIQSEKIDKKTFSARRIPDRMHYRFVVCQRCGLIFSNPIFPMKKIANLYKKSDFDYSREASFLKKTYWQLVNRVIPNIKSVPKLLDIGCGNGFFLDEARRQGITDVWGVEPGRSSVNKAPLWLRKRIKITLFGKDTFRKNQFTMVTCFHTLDHIIDVNDFLKNVWHVLKKDGHAAFVVHDTDGLSVKLLGEKSPIFDIEHIYLFNKKTLAKLFIKNHFKVVRVFDVANTYNVGYWYRMFPLPTIIKRFGMSFLQFTRLGSIPITIKAGNIGIIVQK